MLRVLALMEAAATAFVLPVQGKFLSNSIKSVVDGQHLWPLKIFHGKCGQFEQTLFNFHMSMTDNDGKKKLVKCSVTK